LKGDATFLQRLLVGRTRSSGVKLVSFSEAHVQGFSHYLDARGIRLMTKGGGQTGNHGSLDASRPFGHAKKQSEDGGEGSCHPNHV
jgi:hypothetical protein